MNGMLPGLLDDPQLQLPDLPSLPVFQIAPLRNPAPSRAGEAPPPLEPVTKHTTQVHDQTHRANGGERSDGHTNKKTTPTIRPSDVLSAREAKKPHLAISELLETTTVAENGPVSLPSFVSLSVVEKSPVPQASQLGLEFPHKRPRLDLDSDYAGHDLNRLLPRPAQKDDKHARIVPLLPAMVTGLYEPPPSAALLPSIDLDVGLGLPKASNPKMQMKEVLTANEQQAKHRPPELMLNTPELAAAEIPSLAARRASLEIDLDSHSPPLADESRAESLKRDTKSRRVRRRWTEQETDDLLAGVRKHGFGKWKQILTDPAYCFSDRTSIDLKDRFRVSAKDSPDIQLLQRRKPTVIEEPRKEKIAKVTADVFERDPSITLNSVSQARSRRKRNPWSKEEDDALLQAIQQHGFQWTVIHDDPDFKLGHRRATDLRDRIRNLFPDGYKHAEARPLRSDQKRADKNGKKESEPSIQPASSAPTSVAPPSSAEKSPTACDPSKKKNTQEVSAKIPSIAALTATTGEEAVSQIIPKRLKSTTNDTSNSDPIGVTLPPLDLEDGELNWENNTLAPLLDWEEHFPV